MGKLRVLHLEDSSADAYFVRRAIEQAGLEADLIHVSQAKPFREAISSEPPDVVLLDSGVHGLSSEDAIQLLRGSHPDAPVIFVTGTDDEQQARRRVAEGASDFISKSRLWQLPAAIRRATAPQLDVKTRTMSRLVLAVQDLSLAHTMETVMGIVRRAARELVAADGATFILKEGDLCHYADEDAISPLWKGGKFPSKSCISGWVMTHRTPAVISDISKDERIPYELYASTFVRSLVVVPIRAEDPVGAIGAYWARGRQASAGEVECLQTLANAASIAISNISLLETLEDRVRERTLQLESANRELEAFAYSVSHDLQAPVRRIGGFAQLLAETSGSTTLSEESAHFLGRIRSETHRMTETITDLLRLSTYARVSVKRERTNLSEVATEIVTRLKNHAPERRVEVRIEPGMIVSCDPGLIRIALENLLGNAWKYSSKREKAAISFGQEKQPDGAIAYAVSDNGAGFDMDHASRLFAPFQRLHNADDFAGNGLGLSIVDRIIHKHGGRIWAEGKPGVGASFRFTLPSA